ncbi:MAG TPA: hypothetical protein VK737_04365 [Opitutales bacterium]|jgi:probable HAF family extracellular repeat protein|nr:hypothetical protein [Opitutales bacterium]
MCRKVHPAFDHWVIRWPMVGWLCCGLLAASGVSAQNTTTAASPPTESWTLTALGTFGGENSSAVSINDAGQVVGRAETAELMPDDNWRGYQWGYPLQYYFYHAFLYTDGKMQDLGTLGGKVSYATAINASGQIVGRTMTADDHWHFYDYSDGKMTVLNDDIMEVTGFNDSGQIVGYRRGQSSAFLLPFLYSDGQMKNILTEYEAERNPRCEVAGINNIGMITGVIYSDEKDPNDMSFFGAARPFIYHPEGWMEFIGFYPSAINSAGDVIGWGTTPGRLSYQHAYLYHDQQMQDLGTLDGYDSYAHAINALGEVVGIYGSGAINKEPDKGRAFLYHDGKMQDLNTVVGPAILAKAGFKVLTLANGINSKGQIVGVGIDLHDHDIAFLLTPSAAAHPAPANASGTR